MGGLVLLPVAEEYLQREHTVKPRDRLHRLIARLGDTHYDDLTDERIEALEQFADSFRVTHADGSTLRS